MVKKAGFTKAQLLIISMAAIVVIVPPAKANIMQVLMLIKNFITTNLTGFNAVNQQESAGSQSQMNAMQQSAEVVSGVIANGTKVLGQLEYTLNWKGSGQFNTVSASGCYLINSKNKEVKDAYEDRAEHTAKEELPDVNDYARYDNPVSIEDDRKNRKEIAQIMKDSDFPLSGIFPADNITPAQRSLWGQYVKYLTVPSVTQLSGMSGGGHPSDVGKKAYRFQQLVAPIQKVLLSYGDKYTAESEDDGSRMDVFTMYKAIAASNKRINSLVRTSGAGLDRESALAQAMLLDVEGEIMETNKNITGLLSVMAIMATDEIADEL